MRGDIKFTNNSVEDGGALKLISFAQMKLHKNTTITFSENKGRLDLTHIHKFNVFRSLRSLQDWSIYSCWSIQSG